DLPQPHVQRICGDAFRKFQEFLASLKYSGMEQEVTFSALPPCQAGAFTPDPLIQASISYSGYLDGTSGLNASFALPQTLIRPYKLWERPHGSAGTMLEMDELINGLP